MEKVELIELEEKMEEMNSIELARIIRKQAIEMTHVTHASHVAAVLSVADIVAVLYKYILNVNPKNPEDDARDRFILSKGHAGISVYVSLAYCGFFSVEELKSYYTDGSRLSGHVSHKNVPGVEFSTGALGHGIGAACGMALAAKLDSKKHHVYVLVGDGECQEGEVWETVQFAVHHHLDNLTIIVDANEWQAMGTCEEQMGIHNLEERFEVFGCYVVECNGHDHEQLRDTLRITQVGLPTCVIAHTVKGKGVSFMENNLLWHYRDPQGEFYENAIKELEETS